MEAEKSKKQDLGERPSREVGRIEQISENTKGLFDDIKEWIDLKVQLVQIEIEERFESTANNLIGTLIVFLLAFVTLLFALAAVALGIGIWLGDPVWGFLVVTGILAVGTALVHVMKPTFVKAPWKQEPKKELTSPKKETLKLPEPSRNDSPAEENG